MPSFQSKTKTRRPRWPLLSDYICITRAEAAAIVHADAMIHGYESLRAWAAFRYLPLSWGVKCMDIIDLAHAIRIAIDRTADVTQGDPHYIEKRNLREHLGRLFGPLDLPIAIGVGRFTTVITPAIAM